MLGSTNVKESVVLLFGDGPDFGEYVGDGCPNATALGDGSIAD